MNKRVTDLIEEARKLTPAERSELARRLPRELRMAEEDAPEEQTEDKMGELRK